MDRALEGRAFLQIIDDRYGVPTYNVFPHRTVHWASGRGADPPFAFTRGLSGRLTAAISEALPWKT